MSKRDEDLKEWKKMYDQVHVDECELDDAIEHGFHKASSPSKVRFPKVIWPMLAAVVALLVMAGGVRVSHVFAEKISQIPGMEKMVTLIQGDHSKRAAVEADHFQPLDITEEKGELRLTLEGVIRDDYGIVIFYNLEADGNHRNLRLGTPELMTGDGKDLPPRSLSYKGDGLGKGSSMQMMEVYTQESMEDIEEFELAMSGSGIVDGSFVKENFRVSFQADSSASSREYPVHEQVSIEGERFIIDHVIIHPLRTEIKVSEHPNNRTELLSIDDLSLIGEDGKVWSGINNGITTSGGPGDDELTFYIESNYFEDPESLSLHFSKVMVVDPETEYMTIDVESEEIIYQPSDLATLLHSSPSHFEIEFHEDVARDIGFSSLTDAEGNSLYPSSKQIESRMEGPKTVETFLAEEVKGPLRIDFSSYPHWLEKEIDIPLK